jgi:hypothetical protein
MIPEIAITGAGSFYDDLNRRRADFNLTPGAVDVNEIVVEFRGIDDAKISHVLRGCGRLVEAQILPYPETMWTRRR